MRLKVVIWLGCIALIAAAGCGSNAGESAGQKSDSAGSGADAGTGADTQTTADLGKKFAGPCSSTWVADGKSTPDYVRYKYDSKGRKVDEHTWADLDKYTFTHTWSWNSKGQLAAEKFETSSNDPNFDYKMTYDGDGKMTKKEGSTSTYKEMLCIYEYSAAGGKISLEHCTRTWELFDDEDNLTGTDTDKYIVAYTHGTNLRTAEHMPLNSSSPDKTVWRTYDDKGQLTKLEIDWSTAGYAEEATYYTWDAAGNLTKEEWDQDAEAPPESTLVHTYDSYGNRISSKYSQGTTFKPDTMDPKDPRAKPYELLYQYECKKK